MLKSYIGAQHEEKNRIKSGIGGVIEAERVGVFRGRLMTSRMLDSSQGTLVQASPVYPGEAKIKGIEGLVLLGFTVDESGFVTSA